MKNMYSRDEVLKVINLALLLSDFIFKAYEEKQAIGSDDFLHKKFIRKHCETILNMADKVFESKIE